jgi:cytochrome c5
MRYLSILIAVALTMIFISACHEESPQVAKETPKVIAQEKKVAATAAETAQKNAEKVIEHIEEKEQTSMEHAEMEADKLMEKSHEGMDEQEGIVPATFSVETLATGKMVFEQACATCHATGRAGAPKIGDKKAWLAHIEGGLDDMVDAAINGKGAMPAKGGKASLSDGEVKAAVSYIIEQSH